MRVPSRAAAEIATHALSVPPHAGEGALRTHSMDGWLVRSYVRRGGTHGARSCLAPTRVALGVRWWALCLLRPPRPDPDVIPAAHLLSPPAHAGYPRLAVVGW